MEKKKSNRTNLEKQRTLFFQSGLIIALAITILAFEWKTPIGDVKGFGTVDEVFIDFDPIPPTRHKKTEPPKVKKPKVILDKIKIVDNKKEIKETDFKSTEFIDSLIIEPYIDDEPEVIETIDFFICEDKPEFPGGMDKLPSFIAKNFEMPREIRDIHIVGKTFIIFTIDEFGNVIDASIHYGLDPYIDKEALRVVNEMPKWKPGKQAGKSVRVKYILPIKIQ